MLDNASRSEWKDPSEEIAHMDSITESTAGQAHRRLTRRLLLLTVLIGAVAMVVAFVWNSNDAAREMSTSAFAGAVIGGLLIWYETRMEDLRDDRAELRNIELARQLASDTRRDRFTIEAADWIMGDLYEQIAETDSIRRDVGRSAKEDLRPHQESEHSGGGPWFPVSMPEAPIHEALDDLQYLLGSQIGPRVRRVYNQRLTSALDELNTTYSDYAVWCDRVLVFPDDPAEAMALIAQGPPDIRAAWFVLSQVANDLVVGLDGG